MLKIKFNKIIIERVTVNILNLALMIAWLIGSILCTSTISFAQSEVGIKFEKGLSWSQILEKAKNENKYIFLDAYTTWCVPCKQMAQDIFPKKEVGDFFNQHFINVAVQFDVTPLDVEEVKNWYDEANKIREVYKIRSYPTYLFLNPQGELLHTIIGSTSDASAFINHSKLALDPKTQYSKLKQAYQKGNRDSIFLSNITSMAYSLRDMDSLKHYAQDYLRLQHNLISSKNIALIVATTTKTDDIGFPILRNHPNVVDSIAGQRISSKIVNRIVSDEIVRPMTRSNLTITNHGGGMVVYGGTIIPNVDWQLVKKKLDVDYSDISDEILRKSKLEHFKELQEWKQYINIIENWKSYAYGDASTREELENILEPFLELCKDEEVLEIALKGIHQVIMADKSNLGCQLIYNRLLFKTGKHKLAIKKMKKFVTMESPYKTDALNILKKMETSIN